MREGPSGDAGGACSVEARRLQTLCLCVYIYLRLRVCRQIVVAAVRSHRHRASKSKSKLTCLEGSGPCSERTSCEVRARLGSAVADASQPASPGQLSLLRLRRQKRRAKRDAAETTTRPPSLPSALCLPAHRPSSPLPPSPPHPPPAAAAPSHPCAPPAGQLLSTSAPLRLRLRWLGPPPHAPIHAHPPPHNITRHGMAIPLAHESRRCKRPARPQCPRRHRVHAAG